MNKEILNVGIKKWHSIMQELHLKALQDMGVEVRIEKRLILSNGYKKWRVADIYVPEYNLVIEVQKSNIVPKEFRERNEDYQSLGLKVNWILNEDRWQPDTDVNPELVNESVDIYIKWRGYNLKTSTAQYIYNSNRVSIIDYWNTNSNIDIYYCLPTEHAGMMYRKLESVEIVERNLTPKFPNSKHFGTKSFANHNQPKETFEGYKVNTSVITNETIPLEKPW